MYIIIDIEEDYKDLKGTYDSIQEIRSKIEKLKEETTGLCSGCSERKKNDEDYFTINGKI